MLDILLPTVALVVGIALGLARGTRDGYLAGVAETQATERNAAPARAETAFAAGFRKGVDTCVRAGLHLPENADPDIQERINIRIVHARNPDGDIIKACRSGAI